MDFMFFSGKRSQVGTLLASQEQLHFPAKFARLSANSCHFAESKSIWQSGTSWVMGSQALAILRRMQTRCAKVSSNMVSITLAVVPKYSNTSSFSDDLDG